MNEIDLPVGIELAETEDIYGVPCIELVIQCATKEIALEYYKKSESALKLQKSLRDIFNKYPMNSEYDYKDAWSFVEDVKALLET